MAFSHFGLRLAARAARLATPPQAAPPARAASVRSTVRREIGGFEIGGSVSCSIEAAFRFLIAIILVLRMQCTDHVGRSSHGGGSANPPVNVLHRLPNEVYREHGIPDRQPRPFLIQFLAHRNHARFGTARTVRLWPRATPADSNRVH